MGVPPQPLKILVADDHPLVRRSICEDLQRAGFAVVEASTSEDAVTVTLRERPDLCLIDVRMPPRDGIAATTEILRALPTVHVVLITAMPDEDTVLAAVRAGAVGYLVKDMNRRRLPQVLRAVIGGETSYPRRLLHPVLRAVRQTSG